MHFVVVGGWNASGNIDRNIDGECSGLIDEALGMG